MDEREAERDGKYVYIDITVYCEYTAMVCGEKINIIKPPHSSDYYSPIKAFSFLAVYIYIYIPTYYIVICFSIYEK